MGRPKQPAKIIEAKGKSHMSKRQLKERYEKELRVNLHDITAPKYLEDNLVPEFYEIAAKLASVDVHLFTELDVDTLARYLMSKELFIMHSAFLKKELKKKEPDMTKVACMQRAQNQAFTQCHASASDLGLTVTSRCKIEIPQQKEPERDNRFDRFQK